MTSTTDRADTAQHPDVSEISDLTEGLLSPSRSAAVRRHLDGCALCADVRTSLEEIRGLLGTLPGPPRMPAEIAGRIDAALAAEALLDATAPDTAPSVSRETAVSRETERPSTGAPSSTGRSTAQDRPLGRPGGATGPGRPRASRKRRIALLSTLGGAFGAVLLGTGLFLSQTSAPLLKETSDTKKGDAATVSLSPFSGAPVEERVHALLGDDATAKAPRGVSPESMAAEGGATPHHTRDGAVPACVLAGTGRAGDPVLAFERGQYEGTAAYLVVLPEPGDDASVRAYVLDASCAQGRTESGGDPAELLLSTSVPRA